VYHPLYPQQYLIHRHEVRRSQTLFNHLYPRMDLFDQTREHHDKVESGTNTVHSQPLVL
jgi:hypothetical protein